MAAAGPCGFLALLLLGGLVAGAAGTSTGWWGGGRALGWAGVGGASARLGRGGSGRPGGH